MAGSAASIVLTAAEYRRLTSWMRAGTTPRRLVRRARVVLGSASGLGSRALARREQMSCARSRTAPRGASSGSSTTAHHIAVNVPPTSSARVTRGWSSSTRRNTPAGSIRSRSTFRSSSAKCSLRTTAPACKSWRTALSSSAGGTPPWASRSPGASPAKTWNDVSVNLCFNQKRSLFPQQPDAGPGISGTDYLVPVGVVPGFHRLISQHREARGGKTHEPRNSRETDGQASELHGSRQLRLSRSLKSRRSENDCDTDRGYQNAPPHPSMRRHHRSWFALTIIPIIMPRKVPISMERGEHSAGQGPRMRETDAHRMLGVTRHPFRAGRCQADGPRAVVRLQ
jgi:hypothetical protein